MKHRLLVVDDEPGIRTALKQVLEYEGIEVRTAGSGGEGLSVYPDYRPHVVFLDVKMAGLDGLETLTRLRELDPDAIVVMISGHSTIATAIDATRRGAFDFLEKPLDSDRLLVTVRNALKHADLSGENTRFRKETSDRFQMIGDSAALQAVRETITRVGPTTGRVLIAGENGTGKELVARAVHASSTRRSRPFVEVNCAAIPAELIESELFGHLKGSFTGAVTDREGKFEQADRGTLFLDEIGDMSASTQAKVLRALQEGVITPIGGTKQIQVDVRVIAATNRDLAEEIAAGRFREDLFYRLNVVPITVPPLRDRREDIPALVAFFAKQLAVGAGAAGKRFDAAAVERLKRRSWPGNIRELRNAVERLLILAPGKVIGGAEVRLLLGDSGTDEAEPIELPSLDDGLGKFKEGSEKGFLRAKLREYNWNITETALALNMSRSALHKRMKVLALSKKTDSKKTDA